MRIPLPDYEDRKGIATTIFETQLSIADIQRIAFATDGYSGADLSKLSRDARRRARRESRSVTIDDVMDSLPPAFPISGQCRRVISVHEAAHAVVGVELNVGELQSISVAKEFRGEGQKPAGGTYFQRDLNMVRDRHFYLNQIAMTLAGLAAEEVFFDVASDGAGAGEGSDLQRAADLATVVERKLGIGWGLAYFDVSTSEELETLRRTNAVINGRVERLLAKELDRAREIIERRRILVERIADAVSEKGFLEGRDVLAMIATHDAKPKSRRA
ncbi:hypothetical protein [Pararhizobium sp. A13]|uniref:hypothetical protein n=1 Tax=Pararhizobium sp. A13 TaxID=3133975 RepID=UPI0032435D61